MQRIHKIVSSCFCQLRRLNKFFEFLVQLEVAASLASAFVTSRLDYWNVPLAGLPKSTIASTTGTERCGQTNHWISLELSSLFNGFWCPSELHKNCVCSCTLFILYAVKRILLNCHLIVAYVQQSCIQQYDVPRTTLKFGERAFLFTGPAAWNALIPDLHNLSETCI